MHNFKKLWRAGAVLVAAVVLFLALDYLLYPCTFTRSDIHAVLNGPYDDLYFGTSHGKMGIDPESMQEVSGRSGHNLCVGGEYSQDAYYLLQLILEKGYRPKRVVYEVSHGYFMDRKEEGNNYLLFYHEFPLSRAKLSYFWDAVRQCNFRTALFPWYEYSLSYEIEHLPETVSRKWTGDYGAEYLKSETQEYHESGFIERYPVDTAALEMGRIPTFSTDNGALSWNLDYLDRLIALCKEQGIEFVAVVTPMPSATLEEYGGTLAEAYQFFDAFFEERGVRCLNFNSNQYYDACSHEIVSFTDYDGHLNGEAAREFSKVLAQVLDGTYEAPAAVPQETEPAIAG